MVISVGSKMIEEAQVYSNSNATILIQIAVSIDLNFWLGVSQMSHWKVLLKHRWLDCTTRVLI